MPPAVHFFYRRTAGITSPDVCVRSLHDSLLRSYAALLRVEQVNDPEADKLLTREYRKPFVVPENP